MTADTPEARDAAATTMDAELSRAEEQALQAVAGAADVAALDRLKPEILGRKSPIKGLLKRLGELPAAERPAAGQSVNAAHDRVEAVLETRLAALRAAELTVRLESERVDVTLPAAGPPAGSIHPLTRVLDEMTAVFASMGYTVALGPDVETEYHCFDALNIRADHPARDMHDTFYLDVPGAAAPAILRTHTSPVQIRHLLTHKPPVAIVAPGRVYRVDDIDATHSPVFHQLEGLLVDEGVSFAHLKGTLGEFLRAMFGPGLATRFRPSYFPFIEPSAEVDVQCFVCQAKAPAMVTCRVCKATGWIEVGGAGMVHPAVLENVGLDPAKVSGFAFGLGVERFAMLKYDLSAMRPLYENDVRYLRQF